MTRIREEAVAKVTGGVRYTGDLSLPGMVHGRVVGSPYAHARILSIDTTAARALPGVLAVLTAKDLQAMGMDMYTGDVVRHAPIMAIDKVRHQGEPVAAVAAVDAAAAEEAASLVEVKYQPLPAVTTIEAAMAPGAPLVHDSLPVETATSEPLVGETPWYLDYLTSGSNVYHHCRYYVGDVEKGFAEADRIFEDEFYIPPAYSYPMEPTAVLAEVEGDQITIWTSTQGAFGAREEVAKAFRVPQPRVRSIASYIGTGFGGRGGNDHIIAVALARKAGRPVRLVSSFVHDIAFGRRVAARAKLKTGIRKDGTIAARRLEAWVDGGAYAHRVPWIAEMGIARFLGAYRTANAYCDIYSVFTNTAAAITYRSPGATQLGWAREQQFNIIANKLGLDPVEFRLKNLLNRGEPTALAGSRPQDSDLPGDLRKLAEVSRWKAAAPAGRWRGAAVVTHAASASPPASAIARLSTEGVLTIVCSGSEMGQGLHTAMRKIAALEVGMPVEQVEVSPVVDTSTNPYDNRTGGSRGTTVTGLAVQMAARDVKEQLLAMAAKQSKQPVSSITIKDGMVLAGENTYKVAEVLRRHFTAIIVQPGAPGIVSMRSGVSRSAHPQGRGEILGRGVIVPGFDNGRIDLKPTFWEVGMGVAEVEVDRETGSVKVKKYVGLGDAGKVFDEQTAAGQIEGAAMQGLGPALGEEMLYDEAGQLVNGNALTYRVTKVHDWPDEFQPVFIENGDGAGAFGSRGMGQVHTAVISPAVAGAVGNATGTFVHDLPISPQRLWEALHPPEGGGGATRTKRGPRQEEQA